MNLIGLIKRYINNMGSRLVHTCSPGLGRLAACLMAAGLLASCSDDVMQINDGGENGSHTANHSGQAIYLCLDINTIGDAGTRDATNYDESMDHEDGQGVENTISNVKVVLVADGKVLLALDSGDPESKVEFQSGATYNGVFMKEYDDIRHILESSQDEIEATVYVVCNANSPYTYTLPAKDATQWQDTPTLASYSDFSYGNLSTFKTAGEGDSFTNVDQESNFVMSNADFLNGSEDGAASKYTVKINVGKLKTATSEDKAYPLSSTGTATLPMVVPVQRLLARFDFGGTMAGNYTYYFDNDMNELGAASNNAVPGNAFVKVTVKYVSLGNVNTTFNLFKEVGVPGENGIKGSNWGYFRSEMPASGSSDVRYVLDPLYAGDTGKRAYLQDPSGRGNLSNFYVHHTSQLGNWFAPTEFTSLPRILAEGTWENENNPQYKIWRYCTPNTIHEAELQKNGITTCVVLASALDFGTGLGEGTYYVPEVKESGIVTQKERKIAPIYYFNGKFYGTNMELKKAFDNPRSAKDLLMKEALKNDFPSSWGEIPSEESYSDEAAYEDARYEYYYKYPSKNEARALTAKGVSIFVPVNLSGSTETDAAGNEKLKVADYEYVSIYYYWNRHNDNGDNEVMGPMEFDVVRNNIYKLKLEGITAIGHPAPAVPAVNDDITANNDKDITVDPRPIDSYTDDEIPVRYFTIDSKVVPWGVRVDDDITLY